MLIGQRIRELRESKKMSQGDLEERTGLLRCYTSRVENGHTVPAIETLEKYASALEIPLYKFFYEGKEPPKKSGLPSVEGEKSMWGANENERNQLRRFAKVFLHLNDRERKLLMALAQAMARRNRLGTRRIRRQS